MLISVEFEFNFCLEMFANIIHVLYITADCTLQLIDIDMDMVCKYKLVHYSHICPLLQCKRGMLMTFNI